MWRFYKLTDEPFSADLLKELPMGCKNAVSLQRLIGSGSIKFSKLERASENVTKMSFQSFCSQFAQQRQTGKKICCYHFSRFLMKTIPTIENFNKTNNVLYDLDFARGILVGDFARSTEQLFNTLHLLRCSCHTWYVSSIDILFEAYRCPSGDHFNDKGREVERQLTTLENDFSIFFQKTCISTVTRFWQIRRFWHPLHRRKNVFQECVFLGFTSICVEQKDFKDREK